MTDKKITSYRTIDKHEARLARILGVIFGETVLVEVPDIVTVDDEISEESTNPVENRVIKEALDGKLNTSDFTLNLQKGWIEAQKDGRKFFVPATELVVPPAPTIPVRSYNVVTGSINVNIEAVEGDTVLYSFNGESWIEGRSVIIPSGYAIDRNNERLEISLFTKSIRFDVESEPVEYTIEINPKVSNPRITVNNSDQYAESCTVIFSPSDTIDSVTEFSVDGGTNWDVLSEISEIAVTESQAANKFQIKATKNSYVNSETVKSQAIVLNKKKAFYGFSTKSTFDSVSDITSLIGGGSVKSDKLSGAYVINPTGDAPGYIWLCCVSSLDINKIVPNKGDVIPFGFENYILIDGWKCYRNTNLINPVTTNIYVG